MDRTEWGQATVYIRVCVRCWHPRSLLWKLPCCSIFVSTNHLNFGEVHWPSVELNVKSKRSIRFARSRPYPIHFAVIARMCKSQHINLIRSYRRRRTEGAQLFTEQDLTEIGHLFSYTLSRPSRMRNTHQTQCIRIFFALRFIRTNSTDLFVSNSFVRRCAADALN